MENGSFCIFFPKLVQNFPTQNEQEQSPHLKRAPFKYPKWKFPSQMDDSVFLPNFAQNFLYTQLSFLMSKYAPFKFTKWKLSNQIDSGAFVKIITWKTFFKQIKFQNYVTRDF